MEQTVKRKNWCSRYYDDCRNDGHQFRNCNGDWYGCIAFPAVYLYGSPPVLMPLYWSNILFGCGEPR